MTAADGLPPLPEDSPDYNDLGRALMWEKHAMECRAKVQALQEQLRIINEKWLPMHDEVCKRLDAATERAESAEHRCLELTLRVEALEEREKAVKHVISGIDAQAKRLTRREGDDDIITGYQLNTGLWHRLLGLLSEVCETGSPAHQIIAELMDWNCFANYPEHIQHRVREFVRTGKDPALGGKP